MGLHETLEVHELITFKNLCLTKAFIMSKFAQDPELKVILSTDVVSGRQHVGLLQEFITDRSEENE